MDADESLCRNLSEKDIQCELHSKRYPVLNDRELEAGYAACKKYAETAKDELVLRLQFDCATRLGYEDEAVQIALLASSPSTNYEVTAEMYLALGEYFFGKRDLQRARDNLTRAIAVAQESDHQNREANVDASLSSLENTSTQHKKKKKKKKKKAFGCTQQQDPTSSSHPKESEKEQRSPPPAPSLPASSLTDQCVSIGGSESLTFKNQQKQAAPAQIGFVYQPVPGVKTDIYDTEVEKGEKSIFLCLSNSTQGRHGCDWYRIDLIKKECSKIFSRLEWGGITTTHFGVATVGSIIYILGGHYPDCHFINSRPDWTFFYDVFYFDVNHPRDGWKAGPQLPSPQFDPITACINETIYIFNGKYVFARALDTSDPESGWKSLPDSPILDGMHFFMALPDPIRDRILLLSTSEGFYAYYPRKEGWQYIDYEMKFTPGMTRASAVVDGVLYEVHSDHGRDSDELLSAYDLDQRKQLTLIYSYKVDLDPALNRFWIGLLDLGVGKLCLVGSAMGQKEEAISLLKLKVEKDAGGDKVHITAVSFDTFKIVEGNRFVHSLAL